MKSTSIAELKARLTAYLRQVKAGHEVLITERGTPVAKLVPLQGEEGRKSRRTGLAAAGLLRLGEGKAPKFLLSPPRGKLAGKGVLQALLEERDEGR